MRSGPPCHLITHFRLLEASASGNNPTSINKVSVRSMALNQTYSRAQAIKNKHQMSLQSSWLNNRGRCGEVTRGRSCDYDVSVSIYLAPAGIRSSALSPARSFFSILISKSSPSTTNWTSWRYIKKEQNHYS